MITSEVIPSINWLEIRIGEVCDVLTGNTPSKSDSSNFGNAIPFIKPPNLQHKYVGQTEEMLSSKGGEKSRLVPENSVLVTCIGNLGRTGITKSISAFNQQINAILENEYLLGKFIFYQAQSPLFRLQLEALSAATTVAIVNKGKFETIKIVVPPLAEQQRIVAKIEELFSGLDKGIETLKTAQKQLKVYRQAVLIYAFEGKLTNPNVKEGELPEGWVEKNISDVVIKSTLKEYPNKKSELPFLGMDSIEPHSTKPSFFYKFSEMKSAGNLFTSDQVLYGRMRPYLNKVWVANRSGVASGEFIVLSCKEIVLPQYLLNILHHQDFVNFANSKTSGDRPRISFDEIAEFQFILPPLDDQIVILSKIESRLSVCDKIEESIEQGLQQAEALRQSILKKAFEGKLVPQDPNDEPASVLLERIKAERAAAQPEKKSRTKKTTAYYEHREDS